MMHLKRASPSQRRKLNLYSGDNYIYIYIIIIQETGFLLTFRFLNLCLRNDEENSGFCISKIECPLKFVACPILRRTIFVWMFFVKLMISIFVKQSNSLVQYQYRRLSKNKEYRINLKNIFRVIGFFGRLMEGKHNYLFLSEAFVYLFSIRLFSRAEDFIPSTERLAPPSEKPPPLPPVPPPMIEVICTN